MEIKKPVFRSSPTAGKSLLATILGSIITGSNIAPKYRNNLNTGRNKPNILSQKARRKRAKLVK